MWADGFVGLMPYLTDRCAIVLCSPEAPDHQRAFAEGRGWPYRMVSSAGNTFKQDLGFAQGEYVMPGVSAFHTDGETIRNTANDFFGPGDAYNGAWHFFDLLEGGAGEWQPKISYA